MPRKTLRCVLWTSAPLSAFLSGWPLRFNPAAIQPSSSAAADVHLRHSTPLPDAAKVHENCSLLSVILGSTKTKAQLLEVNYQRQGTDNGAGSKHEWPAAEQTYITELMEEELKSHTTAPTFKKGEEIWSDFTRPQTSRYFQTSSAGRREMQPRMHIPAYWVDPERNIPAESDTVSSNPSDPQSVKATTNTPTYTTSILTIRGIHKHRAKVNMPSCETCDGHLVRDDQHNDLNNTLFGRSLCRRCMLCRRQIWCEGFNTRNEGSEDEEDCDEEYYSALEEAAEY